MDFDCDFTGCNTSLSVGSFFSLLNAATYHATPMRLLCSDSVFLLYSSHITERCHGVICQNSESATPIV